MAPKISTLEIGRKYNLDNRFDPGDLKREIRAKQDRLNQVQQNHKSAGSQLKNQYQQDLIGTLDKEKDLVNLEEEILQLQNLKQQQKVEYNKTLEQFNQQTKIELRQFENDKQKEILELKRQIEEMTDKKNYMEKYPERKTIYEQTLDQLNGEIEQEKIDFDNDQKRQIENFHKKTKEKDQQTKSKIEEQQFQAKQDAWAMIKNSQQTLNENEKLQQNLKLYQQELDELKQQRTDIFSLNENLKMEFDQYEQSTKEYQTLNFKQTQKIKKLKEKYEYLKKFMDTEVKLYPQKLKDIQQKYDEKVQQQNYEFKCLAETLRKKFQEVKHIRGLSQMILDQRTDVEIFLLQALDQIKGEIQRQRKKRFYQFKTDQNNSNINGSIKFPDINLGQDILANSQQVDNQYEEQSIELKKQLNQKIKVSDLDPEDKEKILRIVFEKMNKGQQPINWRQFNKNGNINHDSTGLEEGLGDNSTLQ